MIAETTPEAESTIGEATGQEGGNATAVIPPTTTPSEQEITEPEQPGLLDKIKDLLGLGEITQEQADALEKTLRLKLRKWTHRLRRSWHLNQPKQRPKKQQKMLYI